MRAVVMMANGKTGGLEFCGARPIPFTGERGEAQRTNHHALCRSSFSFTLSLNLSLSQRRYWTSSRHNRRERKRKIKRREKDLNRPPRGSCSRREAPHAHLAQHLLLLVGAADDFFERGEEFLLIVN
jgi:hypothetical protein